MWGLVLFSMITSAVLSIGFTFYIAHHSGVIEEASRMPAAIKNMKFPSNIMDSVPAEKKRPTPLWSCSCGNFTEREQTARQCSKGFAFKTMTAAAQYAKEKCGEGCDPDCRAQNFDIDPSDEDATTNL